MKDRSLAIAIVSHLIEYQRKHNIKNRAIENSLIIANTLYALGHTDVDVKVGTLFGVFKEKDYGLPLPILISHAWVEFDEYRLDCTYEYMDINQRFFYKSYREAINDHGFLLDFYLDKKEIDEIKRRHVVNMMSMKKEYARLNGLDEYCSDYMNDYWKYCANDPKMMKI